MDGGGTKLLDVTLCLDMSPGTLITRLHRWPLG